MEFLGWNFLGGICRVIFLGYLADFFRFLLEGSPRWSFLGWVELPCFPPFGWEIGGGAS